MKIIINFFKSDTLWKQIVGTILATGLIWLIAVLIGLFKGLNYAASIQWTLNLLSSKISLWSFLLLIFVVAIIVRRFYSKALKEIRSSTVSRDELNKKLEKKVDVHDFKRFKDVYDFRRLKNHPWYEQYINDGVESFINMLEEGIDNKDNYKIDNGMQGLALELKEQEWFHGSDKNRILKLLDLCYTENKNHYKSELIEIVNKTRVL
ncbi:hypothetical protein [Arthrospiribacter ruber]|uniref:Uncharacterized protein n=1 Tax=Arthrospiribacter ruber TaxID=2487934 RepID=A0A951ISF9_9BACT|nr:hypothetical protein [Arthrospiribacter ruber]MBW3466618.1 hypothetical protein [Arthrospiribacter ruber]